MFAERKSAVQKIKVIIAILTGFLLPKNTAAKAIHPRPLEILGTKDEILMLNKHPAIAPKNPHIPHEIILQRETLIPFACKTSLSEPVIRK